MRRHAVPALMLALLAGCSGGEFKRIVCVPESEGFDASEEKLITEDQTRGWIYSSATQKPYQYDKFHEGLIPFPSPFYSERGVNLYADFAFVGDKVKIRIRREDTSGLNWFDTERKPVSWLINLKTMTGTMTDPGAQEPLTEMVCRYFPVTQKVKADG